MLELNTPVPQIFFSDNATDAINRQRVGSARRRIAALALKEGQAGTTIPPFQALKLINHLASIGDAFGMAEVLKQTAFSDKSIMYRALRYYGLPRE